MINGYLKSVGIWSYIRPNHFYLFGICSIQCFIHNFHSKHFSNPSLERIKKILLSIFLCMNVSQFKEKLLSNKKKSFLLSYFLQKKIKYKRHMFVCVLLAHRTLKWSVDRWQSPCFTVIGWYGDRSSLSCTQLFRCLVLWCSRE